jgi:hypothetical protein
VRDSKGSTVKQAAIQHRHSFPSWCVVVGLLTIHPGTSGGSMISGSDQTLAAHSDALPKFDVVSIARVKEGRSGMGYDMLPDGFRAKCFDRHACHECLRGALRSNIRFTKVG